MKRARALRLSSADCLALLALAACTFAAQPASAQVAPPGGAQCNDFAKLSDEAQKRGSAVGAAMKAKVDRKEICKLMTNFLAAESLVVKFLEDNKVWCGVPDQVIATSKASHEKSVKFRTEACNEDAPHPKTPTLSEAIKLPSVDSSKNTKTGRGTFDTLTGNPLAR
jgi:hypothetical protein